MAGNSRKVLEVITRAVNKSPMIYNAAIENAQSKLITMRSLASTKYDNVVKQVNGTTIIQDLRAASLQPASPLPQRLVNWWQWYQQLTGLDTVEVAKQHVIRVQDILFKCQEQRRDLTRQVSIINDKLREVYGELVQTRRDDPKYVQLTILENKSLQEQAAMNKKLLLLENEERDYFTQLATAIKEYHDSQAMNAQKYKYLSILASAVLAIVSLTGSMIYNNRRITDVRNLIADTEKNLINNSSKKQVEIISHFDNKIIDIQKLILATEENLIGNSIETLSQLNHETNVSSPSITTYVEELAPQFSKFSIVTASILSIIFLSKFFGV
ncbi:uncharacterized protein LOC107270697 [Cephus cinctus]|uniref:Uncharacterized protein LOC107270697 n=1 Tax=Cephus cinctus TaxID=211228 RepID=A0AAJ7C3Z1_CEPCN|nr:uncharacterized protein LOC107270697 [Cephus cinctus]